MAEKIFQTRIQLKHDTETNWDKATNFKPKDGEVVIYDVDNTHTLPRLKIGDNVTTIKNLPFVGTMTTEEKLKLAKLPTIIISETEPTEDCDLWIDTSVGGGQSVIFTPELKEKLDSIEYGATAATSQVEIKMDTVLSDTSTNGVQNKVITAALATKLETSADGKLAFDKLPVGFTNETVLRGDYGKTAYDHAIKKGNAFDLNLYKFSTNDEGHIINAIPVERADLVNLIGEIAASSVCCLTDMTQNDFSGKTSADWQTLYNEGKHYALVGEESNSWFIVDNLTTDDSEKALSAKQGYVLNNALTQAINGLGSTYVKKSGDTMIGTLSSTADMSNSWISCAFNGVFNSRTAPNSNSASSALTMKTYDGSWALATLSITNNLYFIYGTDANYNSGNNTVTTSPYITPSGQLYGAVWNDYAEYRPAAITTPGYVVREDKSGIMQLADDRLLPACEIISDTFGFAIGETDECKTPIAATGRVLAYPYEDRNSYELGDPVCSGPGGTVSKMSREEVRLYPERMLGYVSEIPSYKTWGSGNVEVNGRIWIRVK